MKLSKLDDVCMLATELAQVQRAIQVLRDGSGGDVEVSVADVKQVIPKTYVEDLLIKRRGAAVDALKDNDIEVDD